MNVFEKATQELGKLKALAEGHRGQIAELETALVLIAAQISAHEKLAAEHAPATEAKPAPAK